MPIDTIQHGGHDVWMPDPWDPPETPRPWLRQADDGDSFDLWPLAGCVVMLVSALGVVYLLWQVARLALS